MHRNRHPRVSVAIARNELEAVGATVRVTTDYLDYTAVHATGTLRITDNRVDGPSLTNAVRRCKR